MNRQYVIPNPRQIALRLKKPAVIAALIVLGICLGASISLAGEYLEKKWAFYACVAVTVIASGLAVRNLRMFLLLVLFIGIPLRLDFRIYAPDDSGYLNGIYLSLPDLCVIGLMMLWLSKDIVRKTGAVNWSFRTALPMLALILAVILSFLTAFSKMWTIYMLAYVLKLFMMYFVLTNSIDSLEEARRVYYFAITALLLASLIIFCSVLFQIDFSMTGGSRRLHGAALLGGRVRPAGTFGHPLHAAAYLTPMTMIALAGMTFKRDLFGPVLCGLSALAGLCALGLTLARGGYMATLAGVLIMGLVGLRRRMVGGNIVLATLVIFVIIALCVGPAAWERIVADDGGSAQGRIPLMKQALLIIRDHPLTGVGANAYEVVMWDYRPAWLGHFWQWKVHNEFLAICAEFGIIGLSAFVWFLYALSREARRCLRSGNGFAMSLGLGALGFLWTSTIMMLSDTGFLLLPAGQAAVSLLGLLAAVDWHVQRLSDTTSLQATTPEKAANDTPNVVSARLPR